MGGHSRPLRCGSARKKQNAAYVLMVYQPRNGADYFGTSQFDGCFYSTLYRNVKSLSGWTLPVGWKGTVFPNCRWEG
ncbi:jg22185 [Pararge aegeria aegeria]|uniref:Jg22185 protein n=1 Tax=Pararge aegeria aegeria TaxID=348720 RepID=A0A8S4SA42_9NEOP|nr:jg22185 [Pararge aegeria aegeria]